MTDCCFQVCNTRPRCPRPMVHRRACRRFGGNTARDALRSTAFLPSSSSTYLQAHSPPRGDHHGATEGPQRVVLSAAKSSSSSKRGPLRPSTPSFRSARRASRRRKELVYGPPATEPHSTARPHTKTSVAGGARGSETSLVVANGTRAHLSEGSFPVLVLNSDYQPLSYIPLSIWPWQEAVKAYFLERVHILATYDNEVRSPSMSLKVPSVVCLKSYHRYKGGNVPAFTRFNVFLRDDFSCQYCGRVHNTHDLTYDHIVPKAKGGKSKWQNVVAACLECNNHKGAKLLQELPKMRLQREPRVPTGRELNVKARKFPPKYLHESWLDYVYWDAPLQEE